MVSISNWRWEAAAIEEVWGRRLQIMQAIGATTFPSAWICYVPATLHLRSKEGEGRSEVPYFQVPT
jgi:hypothetical protein